MSSLETPLTEVSDGSEEAAGADVVGLAVVGLNHATAPIDIREAMAFVRDELHDAMTRLETAAGISECVLLSTCNRTELYFVSAAPREALPLLRSKLDELKGVSVMRDPQRTYVFEDAQVAEHLFRVAAGLDSLIVGETQILTQVKTAYQVANQAQHCGIVLNRLFQAAFRAGKRGRAETCIDRGAVSISSAAAGLALKVFGSLEGRKALIVGAGETGRLAAEHLVEQRIDRVIVANRTASRARELADRLGGDHVPLEERFEAAREVDVLVTATTAPGFLFDTEHVEEIVRRRKRRPLLVLDLSVPRDVDPAVNDLDDVYLHHVDALETMVEQNLARRRQDIPRVEEIIGEELREFISWLRSLAVVPLIKALKKQFDEIRVEQIERYGYQFAETDREQLDRFTRTMLNRILHTPLTQLRTYAGDTRWGAVRLDTVRDLFGLEAEEDE